MSRELVAEKMQRAEGGILLIDGLTHFASAGPHGADAVGALVSSMTRDDPAGRVPTIVIAVAGSEGEVDSFLQINEGIRRRFPTRVAFPSWPASKCEALARQLLARRGTAISADAEAALHAGFVELTSKQSFAGGREVYKLVDGMRNHATARAMAHPTIQVADVEAAVAELMEMHP
jgi:hypothetical protein